MTLLEIIGLLALCVMVIGGCLIGFTCLLASQWRN